MCLRQMRRRIRDDVAIPAQRNSAFRVFARRSLEDSAGKFSAPGAREHLFNIVVTLCMPQLYKIGQLFQGARRNVRPCHVVLPIEARGVNGLARSTGQQFRSCA